MAGQASAQPSSGRTPWGTITRQQIINAATKAIRHDGYEQTTIRSLATDMGVAPMSLYRHVRDKDDLLDEVVDRLLTTAWKPRCDPREARAWIEEAADKLRRFLVTQPAALHVFLAHPVVSPAAVTRMDAMMAVLRDWLGDEAAAERAYAAIHTYTIGFAALEASRSSGRSGPPAGWRQAAPSRRRASHEGTEAGHASESATAVERSGLARRLSAFTTPEQFALGLSYLLDGISRRTG